MPLRGHVILSHGLESGPQATKVAALAAMAESLGWTTERPDYLDLDRERNPARIADRLARLLDRCRACSAPLVLGGSSMGAFISGLASLQWPVCGLFLMAPPLRIQGFAPELDAARVPTTILHGWDDELIPVNEVVAWAQPRRDHLVLVNDTHRLAAHVEVGAALFGRFLQDLT